MTVRFHSIASTGKGGRVEWREVVMGGEGGRTECHNKQHRAFENSWFTQGFDMWSH